MILRPVLRGRWLWLPVVLGMVSACGESSQPTAESRAPTERTEGAPATEPRMLWTRDEVGMESSFLPSGGRLVATDGDAVFVASGFGATVVSPPNTVTALDRASGRPRWQVDRPGPVFIQGVAGSILVVNEQYHAVLGLDVETGEQVWAIDLRALDLEGYGAVASAMTDGLAAIGVSAQGGGSTAPPVILGVDPGSGVLSWQVALAEGTDLTFGTPTVVDDAAVFLSTPSHPGSSPANFVHAVNLGDGSIRWAVPLAGGQGFHAFSALVSPGGVHLPGHESTVTVDPVAGAIRWERSGAYPRPIAVTDSDLWILEADQIVRVDPLSGEERGVLAADVIAADAAAAPIQVPDSSLLLTFGFEGARLVDTGDATTRWSLDWRLTAVDRPLLTGDLLIVATGNRAVTAYELPPLT